MICECDDCEKARELLEKHRKLLNNDGDEYDN